MYFHLLMNEDFIINYNWDGLGGNSEMAHIKHCFVMRFTKIVNGMIMFLFFFLGMDFSLCL